VKTIIWEDLNIETNILTGFTEEIEEYVSDSLEEEDEEGIETEKLISTPFGIYNVKDFFNPIRQYRWNMGHTNFDISRDVLNSLIKVPGIERVVVLSRYRFLIAFGKAFIVPSVKNDIYKILGATQPLSEDVLHKKKTLESIYDKWAIYFLSEKTWDYADESNYDEKIKEFRERQQNENGIVITHETNF
jgi:hypothetical protein